jgi:hypothetical protein
MLNFVSVTDTSELPIILLHFCILLEHAPYHYLSLLLQITMSAVMVTYHTLMYYVYGFVINLLIVE